MTPEEEREHREALEGEVRLGMHVALKVLEGLDGQTATMACNMLGFIAVEVFACAVTETGPEDALEEFDRWCAFTRDKLAEKVRGQLS